MNQRFLQHTVIPFVRDFLAELNDYTKQKAEDSHQSFEKAFLEYFDKSAINKRRLNLLTWKLVEKIKGKKSKLFSHLENDQTAELMLDLLRTKYRHYKSAYKFQDAFFEDEDGSNHRRVKENIYLFSTHFNNEAEKKRGVELKTCSDDEVKKLHKLLKSVLGEKRYQQVAPSVFLGKNQVYVSQDLAFELESAFQLMIENKFEDAEGISEIEVAFDRDKMSLEAVIKAPSRELQILSSYEDILIYSEELDEDLAKTPTDKAVKPVVELENLEGETLKLHVEVPNLDAQDNLDVNKANLGALAGGGARLFDFDQGDGTEGTVTHVGPTDGYNRYKPDASLPLSPRKKRFLGGKSGATRERIGQSVKRYSPLNSTQDYAMQRKATQRFNPEENKMVAQEPTKPDQTKKETAQAKSQKKQQVSQVRGGKRRGSIWKIVAASAGISGMPIGLAGFAGFMTDPQKSSTTTKTIASVMGEAHHMLASFIGLFV